MNKKVLVIMGALFMVLVLLISACAKTPEPAAPADGTKPAPSQPEATEPIEIKVAFGDSSASVFHHSVLVPWGEEIEAASNGKLKVTHFPDGSLGPANEHWDLAVKGLADVSWQITLLSAGVFPLTDAVTLPPTGIHSAEKMNVILWDLYKNNEYFQKEYQDAKVLFFAGGPPQWYWANKSIKAVSDVKGLRVGSTGGPAIEAIQLHGGSPTFFLPMDMYLSLEKGTIDGVAFIAEGVAAFKLNEIADYCCTIDMCTFPAVVAMNHNFFDKLPADLQKVVDEVSSKWNAKAGKVADDSNLHAAQAMKDAGVEFYEPAENELESWYTPLSPMLDTWKSTVDGLGMPGQEIMDEVLKLSDKY
jgi:TRAP-type C4-dicarboxylate transport system substrate-binding protein